MKVDICATVFIFLLAIASTSAAEYSVVTGEEIKQIASADDIKVFEFDASKQGYYITWVEIISPNEPTNVTVRLYGHSNEIAVSYSTSPAFTYEKYDIAVYQNGELVDSAVLETWMGKLFEDYLKLNLNYNGLVIQTNINVETMENVTVHKQDPPIKVIVQANRPVSVRVYGLQDPRHFAEQPHGQGVDPWTYVNKVVEIITSSWNLIMTVFWYFKLLLIDHGIIVFGVWESLVLLYASATSRDIFVFLRRVVRAHRALIEFIIQVIRWIVQLFTSVIQAIGSLIPFT